MEKRMQRSDSASVALQKGHQNYVLLKEEVSRWLDERGPFWKENLRPADAPPYFPLKALPEEAVIELWERLNRLEGDELSGAALKSLWSNLQTGQPEGSPERLSRLHFAVSGTAQLAQHVLKDDHGKSDEKSTYLGTVQDHQAGAVCPVCGEGAALSVLTPPNGKRFLHCSMCGQEWPAKRVGCIRCGSEDAAEQIYLHTEEFPGVEMVVCQGCGQYFKELDLRVLTVDDFIWEDLRTLPLNYAAEQWLAEQAKQRGSLQ